MSDIKDELNEELEPELEKLNKNASSSTSLSIKQDTELSDTTQDAITETLGDIREMAFEQVRQIPIQDEEALKSALDNAVQLAAMAGAIDPTNESNHDFLDSLKKEKQRTIKSSAQTDKYKQNAKRTYAKQQRNEAFYKAFRPILEFDFNNITDRPRKNEKTYDDRSYGLSMMILMLIIFTPFYVAIAITLMLCKSIDVVCTYISQFSKTAARVCIWLFLIAIITLILYIIISWVEQRFGLSIIHAEQALNQLYTIIR